MRVNKTGEDHKLTTTIWNIPAGGALQGMSTVRKQSLVVFNSISGFLDCSVRPGVRSRCARMRNE
jgi:hypothetical protein